MIGSAAMSWRMRKWHTPRCPGGSCCRRVKLGTAVLLSALRHPVLLANEAANVDILSQGRLTLGLGIASRTPTVEREFAACGVPFGRRLGMFEEGVEIMRRLWTDARV